MTPALDLPQDLDSAAIDRRLEALRNWAAKDTHLDTPRELAAQLEAARARVNGAVDAVVFIGAVGVGKTTVFAHLLNLVAEPHPTTVAELVGRTVLPTSPGRTSACELELRGGGQDEQIQVEIKPLSSQLVTQELARLARRTWNQQGEPHRAEGEDPAVIEMNRRLLNLVGLPERRETKTEGGRIVRSIIRPLDQWKKEADDLASLGARLLAAARLESRQQTLWTLCGTRTEQLLELKALLSALNEGSHPDATLPDRLIVTLPGPLPGALAGRRLIDTRGIESGVGLNLRGDLRSYLEAPDVLPVLCAPFDSAPGEALRTLLREADKSSAAAASVRRGVIVLVDRSQAALVVGADGDPSSGQVIKEEECRTVLADAGLSLPFAPPIVAVDSLLDPSDRILSAIHEQSSATVNQRSHELALVCRDVDTLLAEESAAKANEDARRVDYVLARALATINEEPLAISDRMASAIEAVEACPHGTRIRAMVERNGRWPPLDLHDAMRGQMVNEIDAQAQKKLLELNKALPSDDSFASPHGQMRARQARQKILEAAAAYGEDVFDRAWKQLFEDETLWRRCEDFHGKGTKAWVIEQLKDWAQRQIRPAPTAPPIQIAGLASAPPAPERGFALRVSYLRALDRVEWSPDTLALVIGGNGTGKSTLMGTLLLLRRACEVGLTAAVSTVFGGAKDLRHWGAPETAPIRIDIERAGIRWSVELVPREGSVAYDAREELSRGDTIVFRRDPFAGGLMFRGEWQPEPEPGQTALGALFERRVADPSIRRMATFLRQIRVYRDLDVARLKEEGSRSADVASLSVRGTNALSLLRAWKQDPPTAHLFAFVEDTLKSAFPAICERIGFTEAGNTLAGRIYPPGRESPSPLAGEANGLVQLLILATALAEAPEGSVVAFDEPENGLHPYAQEVFLRRAEGLARRRHLTIIISTHSTVLLDQMNETPERVFVMRRSEGPSYPPRLDQLESREWLAEFRLGQLHAQGDLGDNRPQR
jgi:predicted ATPase